MFDHSLTDTHFHTLSLSLRLLPIAEPTSLVRPLSPDPSPNGRTIPACTSAAPHASISIHSVWGEGIYIYAYKNKRRGDEEAFGSAALSEVTESEVFGGGAKAHGAERDDVGGVVE